MHLFLVLLPVVLFPACSGGTSENSKSLKIQAFAGETAVLPCNISLQNDNPTVEWSKEGLNPDTVFLYRDGCETYEIKNLAFWHRTNLFLKELKNGNISLRISNLQLSDAGTYICTLVQREPREVARLELVVVAVSEPKLSAAPADDGGVTLQCETNCWFPKPEITFLDEHGNNIDAEEPKINLHSGGCYIVTRRATVQTASNRTTCRVHQPDINQTRVMDVFHITDNSWSSCAGRIMAVVIPIVICVLIGILCAVYKFDKFYICEGWKKAPVPEPSPKRNQADNDRNAAAGYQRKVQELKLEISEKDKMIKRLTDELNDLRSKLSTLDNSLSKSPPDVSQSSQPANLLPHRFDNSSFPKPGNSPKRNDSTPGSPVETPASRHPADDGAASPPSEKGLMERSMSLSRPRQNIVRSPRRNTISAPLNNRFSVLGSLSEDAEPLMK